MAKKRVAGVHAADRITALPCSIIDHILQYLPLRDAVRMSILSKDWRYKWLTIPCLNFNRAFENSLHEGHDLKSVIFLVLLLHKGPIVKFSLKDTSIKTCPILDHWLHFLSRHCTENLRIKMRCAGHEMPHMMPRYLFHFDHLRELHLENVEIIPPPTYKAFGSLVTLDLMNVYIAPKLLKIFISKCPVLEFLRIRNTTETILYSPLHLDYAPPTLKIFHYWGIVNHLFGFENASLENIEISYPYYSTFSTGRHKRTALPVVHGMESTVFIEFFRQLSSVNQVRLNSGFLEFLATGGVPQKLPIDLRHLTTVIVSVAFAKVGQFMITLCLIRSSPNLRRLVIEEPDEPVCSTYVSTNQSIQYLKEQGDSEVPLCCNLRYVEIDKFTGSTPEIEFVRLVLLWATALEKLEFKSYACYDVKVLKKLLSFRRASSEAVIICCDEGF